MGKTQKGLSIHKGYRLAKECKSEHLMLLVRPTLKETIRLEAKAQGLSMNELANTVFEEYLGMGTKRKANEKTVKIHDAVADPPKKSGKYIAFSVCENVVTGEYLGGYWTEMTYGKDYNAWNVSIDPRTGLTTNADSEIDTISHWFEKFDPHEEAEA